MDDNFYDDFKEWDKLRKKKNLANVEKKVVISKMEIVQTIPKITPMK